MSCYWGTATCTPAFFRALFGVQLQAAAQRISKLSDAAEWPADQQGRCPRLSSMDMIIIIENNATYLFFIKLMFTGIGETILTRGLDDAISIYHRQDLA